MSVSVGLELGKRAVDERLRDVGSEVMELRSLFDGLLAREDVLLL